MQHIRVSEILARLKDFSHIDERVLNEKAKIGTEVHKNIHEYNTNGFPMFDTYAVRGFATSEIKRWEERGKGYFQSYTQWHKRESPKYTLMEKRLFDDTLMITGQIDALISSDPLPVLVDFKCSYKEDLEMWGMQAHFYKYLLDCNGIRTADHFLFMKLNKDSKMPRIFRIDFDEHVLSRCIDEAIKYWEEKTLGTCVA